jgi:hypothetical protein
VAIQQGKLAHPRPLLRPGLSQGIFQRRVLTVHVVVEVNVAVCSTTAVLYKANTGTKTFQLHVNRLIAHYSVFHGNSALPSPGLLADRQFTGINLL